MGLISAKSRYGEVVTEETLEYIKSVRRHKEGILIQFNRDELQGGRNSIKVAMWLTGKNFLSPVGERHAITATAMHEIQPDTAGLGTAIDIVGSKYFNMFPEHPDCLYLPVPITDKTTDLQFNITFSRLYFGDGEHHYIFAVD